MNFKQRKLMKIIACIVICCLSSPTLFADDSTPTPAWYRYYDNNGVATISSSVSPAHIRRGYDVLDRRMQVLRHVPAFSSERTQQSAQSHAIQSKQRETDQRLKQAYTSSRTAELKKQEALQSIKTQIGIQQRQAKEIYTDQLNLRRAEQEYVRQGKSVPPTLKNQLKQNDNSIERSKSTILNLQNNYRETQLKYDRIISRLKLME
ncbi:hypothetical protein LVY74_15110 [Acinetobacter sp. ME22]|uniref:hypothetical protein n=1 Tax=Acinetobacter sp. ME22 TaxID=2904802 RepID=UPI001EDB942E|nr:hypothetical protein [Acinetobacter sp. ME22]MCG2574869.1 hypothetical protein [Acinetobacter sp. ME22]